MVLSFCTLLSKTKKGKVSGMIKAVSNFNPQSFKLHIEARKLIHFYFIPFLVLYKKVRQMSAEPSFTPSP